MDTRREFIRRLALLASSNLLADCRFGQTMPIESNGPRLESRPGPPRGAPELGLHPLGSSSGRDGLLYVPESYRPDRPEPLVVMLHGAGRDASEMMTPHLDELRASGLPGILLAVDSRGPTWDGVREGFGRDVQFLDRALAKVFSRCNVHSDKVAIAGFSDGATDAIGLGLANGDLFSRVTAYAPGSLLTVTPVGHPRFFITHGTRDTILPIEATRLAIVPGLRQAGYEVDYHEWDGGHGVSPDLLRQALQWMVA
jgi:phospholipase/carboxylesterase